MPPSVPLRRQRSDQNFDTPRQATGACLALADRDVLRLIRVGERALPLWAGVGGPRAGAEALRSSRGVQFAAMPNRPGRARRGGVAGLGSPTGGSRSTNTAPD